MACVRTTNTNQGESILFNIIYENLYNKNENEADRAYAYFRSNEFLNDFGDYVEAYNANYEGDFGSFIKRVDDNGEPKLLLNETSGKYYYINQQNEKIYFPPVDKGLRALFSYEQINDIVNILALKYFEQGSFDVNSLNIEELEGLVNLETFVREYITNKVAELSEVDDLEKIVAADLLESSLEHISEWIDNIKNFYSQINLKIVEEEAVDEFGEVESSPKDPVFNKASFERSTKDNITNNIKLKLSLIKDVDNLDPILNEPLFLSFNEVYNGILKVLEKETVLPTEDSFQVYREALTKVIPSLPYMKQVVNLLDNFDKRSQNQFSQAFSVLKNNFIVSSNKPVEVIKNGRKVVEREHSVINISNTGNRITSILETWDFNFKDRFLKESNLLSKELRDSFTKGLSKVKEIKLGYDALRKNFTIETFEALNNQLLEILFKLGVPVSENAFTDYLTDLNKDISFEGQVEKLITLSYQVEKTLEHITKSYNTVGGQYNSPFRTSSIFRKLAEYESLYMKEESDSTVIAGDKKLWIYSYPSSLKLTVNQWKKDPNLLINRYESSEFMKGSYLMGVLSGAIDQNGNALEYNTHSERVERSKKMLDNYDVAIFVQMELDGEYSPTQDLSKRDYIIDHVNKILLNDYSRTLSLADKTTDTHIKTGIKVNAFSEFSNKQVKLTRRASDVYINYLLSEYNRIIEAHSEVDNALEEYEIEKRDGTPRNSKLTVHYHFKEGSKNVFDKSGNAFSIQMFPKLSPNAKNQTKLEKSITDLLYKDGKPIYDRLDLNEIDSKEKEILRNRLQEYIEIQFNERFLELLQYFFKEGIFEYKEDGGVVSNYLDRSVLENYSKYGKTNVLAIITDYLFNSHLQHIEYSKMFTGDPAYYKNMADYKKRVPATNIDGLILRLTPGDYTFNIATINSVNISSPFLEEMSKALGVEVLRSYGEYDGEGKPINSTDAQAWITPKRWKILITGLGKWTKTHDSLYKKMISKEPQVYELEELKIAAQPLKGVYFGLDSNNKPVYLKYSQAVLSPNLINNLQLENMLNIMESQNVDELITLDGVKVGAIEPTSLHDADGNILSDVKLNIQTLHNNNWRLQQDLPTKTFDQTKIGSQLQKNIFAGLLFNRDNEDFFFDGSFVSGQFIIDEIVKTVTGLSNYGLSKLKKELDISEDYSIGNIELFYKRIKEDLIKRGGSKNIIEALDKSIAIYGIPQDSEKLYNIFASIVNDRLIKIKTNGGSFIQTAGFGFTSKDLESKPNILINPLADSRLSPPLPYIDAETGKLKIKPGGIFIPASFISKQIPDWASKDPKELFGYMDENGNFVEGIIDRDILENIIGYRIPNQGLSSNDPLMIAGILPESMGDVVIPYLGVTSKTGSDFDIDKMFLMIPNFRAIYTNPIEILNTIYKGETISETIDLLEELLEEFDINTSSMEGSEILKWMFSDAPDPLNNIKESFRNAVIERIFKDPELRKKFKEKHKKDIKVKKLSYIKDDSLKGQQNKLIELYKAVLTNPTVYNKLMRSVDVAFFKNEIEHLNKEVEEVFLNHFDPLVEINLRYSLLSGKEGVGQEANAMVDINRIGELFMHSLDLQDWGYSDKSLDKEYSEELSEKDLNYYVEDAVKTGLIKESEKDRFKEYIKAVELSESMTAILNAFVDIAKNNYISKGNWNTNTTNTGNLLLRKGVHPLYIISFLSNPVLKSFIEYEASMEGLSEDGKVSTMIKFKKGLVAESLREIDNNEFKASLSQAYLKYFETFTIEERIEELEFSYEAGFIDKSKFENSLKSLTNMKNRGIVKFREFLGISKEENEKALEIFNKIKKLHTSTFNPKSLNIFDKSVYDLEYWRNSVNDKQNLEFHLNVLQAFIDLRMASKSVRHNVMVSKLDTDGMGKNISTLYALFNLKQFITEGEGLYPLSGFETKFVNSPLGAFYNNLTEVLKVVQNNPFLFPQGVAEVQNVFNNISQSIYNTPLFSEDLAKDLEKAYKTYVMDNFLNISSEEITSLLNELPKRVEEFRSKNPDYFFLNELEIKQSRRANVLPVLRLNNRQKSKNYEDAFTDSWYDLLLDHPKLAEDLIKYSFITSGFNMNTSQFYKYIPHQYFINKDFNSFISDFSKTNQQDFFDKFFLNHLGDPKKSYVKNVFQSQTEIIKFNGKDISIYDGFLLKTPSKNAKPYVELKPSKTIEQEIEEALSEGPEHKYFFKLVGYTIEDKPIYRRVREVKHKVNMQEFVNYGKSANVVYLKFPNSPIKEAVQELVENDPSSSTFELKTPQKTQPESEALGLGQNKKSKFNLKVYDKIDNDAYSISIDFNNRRYTLVLTRDGEVVDSTYYDPNRLKDVDSKINLSKQDVIELFNEIENTSQTTPQQEQQTQQLSLVNNSQGLLISNTLGSEWKTLPVYSEKGINTMRTENKEAEYAHFGNPFSEAGYAGTIKVPTVKDAIQAYKDWLLGDSQGFELPLDKTGKDQGKADLANAFIGYKVSNRNSSTGQYLDKANELGIPANENIQPGRSTVAFVSVASEGINNQKTIDQAKKVIKAGGTIIMDASGTSFGKSHSSFNKKGEGSVQDALGKPTGQTSKGYNYWGVNPEQRQWILEQINSGKLDNATLLYSKKLADRGLGSHAEALLEVIQEIRGIESNIQSRQNQQLSLFDNSQELWNENKELLESNGMNEESFYQMYNEFGEDFIREYIKKCKR